jgi:hypothetical protein
MKSANINICLVSSVLRTFGTRASKLDVLSTASAYLSEPLDLPFFKRKLMFNSIYNVLLQMVTVCHTTRCDIPKNGNYLPYHKMTTTDKTIWCHILGDHCLNIHCREYLISDRRTNYVWWVVYGHNFALLFFRHKTRCHWQTLGTQIQIGPEEEAAYSV